jgi:lipopolysaccharide biosynthesis glycosyltransferase
VGFAEIVRFARHCASYDGGDQGILNGFFAGNYNVLPPRYNILKHYYYYGAEIDVDPTQIHAIHYIVKKPWELKYKEEADAFLVSVEDIWTKQLEVDDIRRLVSRWRREIFMHYERQRINDPARVLLSQEPAARRIRRRLTVMLAASCGMAFALALLLGFRLGQMI